jgi:hypothetical protein
VRVLRDRRSASRREIDKKIISVTGHRLDSGGVVVVGTYEDDYDRMLDRIAEIRPQLVILDSPADLDRIRATVGSAVTTTNACGPEHNCPAFIPPWVSGDQLKASEMVLAAAARASK